MKSSNPDSGCNQVTVAPTLDTWSPDPSLNQGGIAIVQTTQPTVIVFAPGPMVRFGGNIWEGIVPTLRAESHRGDAEPHILIIDGTRVDDVRVYEGPVQTLKERMGTGGNNVPIIAFGIDGYNQTISDGVYHTIDARTHKGDDLVVVDNNYESATDVNGSDIAATLRGFGHGWQGQHNSTHAVVTEETESVLAFDGYNQSVTEDIYRALRIGIDSGDCIAIPIDMRNALRDPEKYDEVNRQGLGVGKDGEPSHTITGSFVPGVATGDTMQVRRLTPVECERLMGWPDNHTLPRSDGKQNPDTTRYKMCGNGVASPVAQWIGQNLMEIMGGQ